jgi:hypothetical protein
MMACSKVREALRYISELLSDSYFKRKEQDVFSLFLRSLERHQYTLLGDRYM